MQAVQTRVNQVIEKNKKSDARCGAALFSGFRQIARSDYSVSDCDFIC